MYSRFISEFQFELATAVDDMLRNDNIEFEKVVQGETETHIYYNCDNKGLQIWVYDDEAEYKASQAQKLFDHGDYESLDQLKENFLSSLSEVCVDVNRVRGSRFR